MSSWSGLCSTCLCVFIRDETSFVSDGSCYSTPVSVAQNSRRPQFNFSSLETITSDSRTRFPNWPHVTKNNLKTASQSHVRQWHMHGHGVESHAVSVRSQPAKLPLGHVTVGIFNGVHVTTCRIAYGKGPRLTSPQLNRTGHTVSRPHRPTKLRLSFGNVDGSGVPGISFWGYKLN